MTKRTFVIYAVEYIENIMKLDNLHHPFCSCFSATELNCSWVCNLGIQLIQMFFVGHGFSLPFFAKVWKFDVQQVS